MKVSCRVFVYMILGTLWCGLAHQAAAVTQDFESWPTNTPLNSVPGWQAPQDHIIRKTSLISILPGGTNYDNVGYTNQGVEAYRQWGYSKNSWEQGRQQASLWTVTNADVLSQNGGLFQVNVRLSNWTNATTSVFNDAFANGFWVLVGTGIQYETNALPDYPETDARVVWTNATGFAICFRENDQGDRKIDWNEPGFDNFQNGLPGFGTSSGLLTSWNRKLNMPWERDKYYTIQLSNILFNSSIATQATAVLNIFETANPANVLTNNLIVRGHAGSAPLLTAPFTNINQVAFAVARKGGLDHYDNITLTNLPQAVVPCPLPQDFEAVADGTSLNSVSGWVAPADYVVRQTSLIDTLTNGVNYGSAGYNNSKGCEATFQNSVGLQGALLTMTNTICNIITNDGALFQAQVRLSSWQFAISPTNISQNATNNGFALLLGSGMTASGGTQSQVNWTNATAFGVYFHDNGSNSLMVYTDRVGFDDPTHAFPGFSLTEAGLTNWNSSAGDWQRDKWYMVVISNVVLSTSSGVGTGATARLWVYESANPANLIYSNALIRSHIGSSSASGTSFSQIDQLAFIEGRFNAVDAFDNISLSVPTVADFSANPTSGTEILGVTFNDTSTGLTITNRHWDFGNGTLDTNATSFVQNYAAGTYTVTLTVSGLGGTSSVTKSNLITAWTQFQAWQLLYFGCTGCPQAAGTADPDGDGINNTNEFLAGTNPTNSLSGLRITSVVRQGNGIRITWLTAGGRTNEVQATTGGVGGNYATNGFTNISGNIIIPPGPGDVITNYTEATGATNGPSRYYRIRLVP